MRALEDGGRVEKRRLRITVSDWLKLLFFLVVLFLIYRLISVIINTIILALIGAIFAYILHPFVNALNKRGLPRWAAVIVVIVAAFLIDVLVIYLVAPTLVTQTKQLVQDLPTILQKASVEYTNLRNLLPAALRSYLPPNLQQLINATTNYVQSQSQRLAAIIPSIFAAIAGSVLVAIFTIYILLFIDEIDSWLRLWIPDKFHWLYDRLVDQLDTGYAGYIIGQIIVSLAHGVAVVIVAVIFGLPFAIIQGFWAAIIQLIPIIGPVLAVIPTVLLAFIVSIRTGIIVTVIVTVVNSVLGVVLTPYILGAAVEISPLLIFFAIVAGAEVGGVGGAVLAVPLLVFLNLIWLFLRDNLFYRPAPPPTETPTTIEMQPPDSEDLLD